MLHTSGNIIDDIQDSSILRKGIPVTHSVFGIASSLSAAAYILFIALERVINLRHPAAPKVCIEQLLKLQRGQGIDIFWWDNFICPREEDYKAMAIKNTTSDCLHTWMKSMLNELPVQGEIISNLHISLSRTLVLKFHWIESFVESLKLLCSGFHPFVVQLTDVKMYCNEEKTRTFLGIYCQNEDGTLKHLTDAIDCLLAEYQLPSFYEDISYHISFFWCLGDKQTYLKKILPSLTCSLNKYLAENVEDTYIHVKEIQCKIGNKCYSFGLK